MQKWEYDVWYLDTSLAVSSIGDELERRGREGWELVATPVVWNLDPENSGRQLVGVLKRPVGAGGTERPGSYAMLESPAAASDPPEPMTEDANDVDPTPADPPAVAVVDEMIRRAEADLVAIKRQRLVADDELEKARATQVEVELHLLRQSRAWVSTDADIAWVQSGREAWRSAQRPSAPASPRMDRAAARRALAMGTFFAIGSDPTRAHNGELVDADELRRLFERTRDRRIGFLLAQECAAYLIARDPSRTDRDVEKILRRVAGRRVIGRTRIATVRERMERSGVIPVPMRQRERPAAAGLSSTTVSRVLRSRGSASSSPRTPHR